MYQIYYIYVNITVCALTDKDKVTKCRHSATERHKDKQQAGHLQGNKTWATLRWRDVTWIPELNQLIETK